MISLQNISFDFGGRYLYKDASWHIKPGQRIGLIGRNGTGKSTLLKIITGEISVSEGIIGKQNSLKISYLHQDLLSVQYNTSILEVAMMAFADVLEIEHKLHEKLHALEKHYTEELLEEVGELQHAFEMADGYRIQSKASEVLEGLGFKSADLQRPLEEFSGGWRMRVILAQMLLTEPDLLMLDEPTNHLDLPSIEWLEGYLNDFPGAVIVVSHDRQFLDKVCRQMVEIRQQKFHHYEGNYSFYLEEREERMDLLQREFDNQQQYIKDQEKFINRFRAKASKATAVQSRIKQLGRLDMIEAPDDDEADVKIKFSISTSGGKIITAFEHISKSYGPQSIFKNIHGQIERGDKIALIGANGTGKTTLLNILAGKTDFTGTLTPGYQVNPSVYAQHQLDSLTLENTILDELRTYAPDVPDVEIRTLLGCFLFTGDDVFKKIRVLSGGEKSRVALAKTLLTRANFLLLDEPTNHLDMKAVNILASALVDYAGTLLMVSHDRHFIRKVANKIWWIENNELKEYPGTYDEYLIWETKRKKTTQPAEVKNQSSKAKLPASEKPKEKSVSQWQKEIQDIEAQISQMQNAKIDIEKQFETVKPGDDFKQLSEKYEQLGKELANLHETYDQIFQSYIESNPPT